MEKAHMDHLLNTRPGVGVEVTNSDGHTLYYFYEDFNGPGDGIQRAMDQLYPLKNRGVIDSLTFIERSKSLLHDPSAPPRTFDDALTSATEQASQLNAQRTAPARPVPTHQKAL